MYILKKSIDNKKSAKTLIGLRLYAPSVHCSYYCCYQRFMHKLNECGTKYETQSEESSGKDSHNYLIRKVRAYSSNIPIFNRNIESLKRLRKLADYENVEITEGEAKKALGNAETVLNIIK